MSFIIMYNYATVIDIYSLVRHLVCFHSWYAIFFPFFFFFDSTHDKIYFDIYLKIFVCILVLYTHQIYNIIIRNVSCSSLLHIKYEKHYMQYLTKESVSSKYRVEPGSKKKYCS